MVPRSQTYLATNLVSVALVIPWSMLVQRWLYGIGGRSLHSVLAATMERSAGSGSAVYLLPCVLLTIITAVIWYGTRRTGPARTTAAEGGEG